MTLALVLVLSLAAHELAHAWVAARFGDPTPRRAGRLTLNPAAHLHWLGSGVLPALLAALGSPVLVAWAKPVPVDGLRLGRAGLAATISAGPAINMAIGAAALLCGRGPVLDTIAAVNFNLVAVNLFPVKPLDGWWLSVMVRLWVRQVVRAERRVR